MLVLCFVQSWENGAIVSVAQLHGNATACASSDPRRGTVVHHCILEQRSGEIHSVRTIQDKQLDHAS